MNGLTHKVAGACTGAIAASMIPGAGLQHYEFMIAGALIGSIYPDLDEPNSIFGSRVKPLSWLAKIFLGHRGIIHTPLNCAVITGLLYLIHIKYGPDIIKTIDYNTLPWVLFIAQGFCAGYLSHLLLDTLTPQGIMLLYPFSTYKIHIFGFRGIMRDIVFSGIMITFTALYFLSKFKIVKLIVLP